MAEALELPDSLPSPLLPFQPRPFEVDRVAWLLIRKFGPEAAIVAYARAQYCSNLGHKASAAQWQNVLARVVELDFAPGDGTRH